MKKIVICVIVCAFMLSVFACGTKATSAEAEAAANGKDRAQQSEASVSASAKSDKAAESVAPVEQKVASGTRNNPLPMNTTALFDGMSTMFDTFKVEVTLTQVIRGDEALQMAMDGNEFNQTPPEGMEYMFAKFKIKALESKEDAVIDVNNSIFTAVSGQGTKYEDFVSVTGLEPAITEMYAGAEQEGYTYFYVSKDDVNPSIVFLDRDDGGIWFTTDANAKLAENSETYMPAEGGSEAATAGQASGEAGSRTNPVAVNTTAAFDGMSTIFDTYKVDLTLTEVIRGEEALQMVKDGNEFNSEPPEGMEYLFAKFKIKALDSSEDAAIDINNSCFELVSEQGKKYEDFVSVAGIKPVLAEMYKGAEQEGYVAFLVNVDDANPSIVFLERNDDGIWFALK